MSLLLQVLDLTAAVAALAAAWFWYKASGRRLRRVSYFEELDAADINRVVTVVNRSNLLNSRAALATAVSAACLAARLAAGLVAGS